MPAYNSRMWGTVYTYRCAATGRLVTKYTRKGDPYRRTITAQSRALSRCKRWSIHISQVLPIAGCRTRDPRKVRDQIRYNLTTLDVRQAYQRADSSKQSQMYLDNFDPKRVPVDYYFNRNFGFPEYKAKEMRKYYEHIDRLTARGECCPQPVEYYNSTTGL
jgi:hypothetical protein